MQAIHGETRYVFPTPAGPSIGRASAGRKVHRTFLCFRLTPEGEGDTILPELMIGGDGNNMGSD